MSDPVDEGDLSLARRALRAILVDASAPAAAKASAARTLAELAGGLGPNRLQAPGDLAPFEMSRDEIAAELHGLSPAKARKS